jgi:pimeloyl-ACP methyl ester carboxylesterase
MYLNTIAPDTTPLDLTDTQEAESLLGIARELGVPVPDRFRWRSRNVVVSGLRFHLLEWGEPSRPPILMLHGGGESAHSWDLVALALSDRYHVIALDQRGHGDTEWPRDGNFSMHAMAEDIQQILTVLGLEQPTLVGHSMGGRAMIAYLLSVPGGASRAIIVDISPEVPQHAAERGWNYLRGTYEFSSLDEYVERVMQHDPFRSRSYVEWTARYALMLQNDGKLVRKHDPRRMLEEATHLVTPEEFSIRAVHRITCPVLVVRGEHSRVLPADTAEHLASLLPNGSLVTVPACGHNVHTQNVRGFLAAIEPFLPEA